MGVVVFRLGFPASVVATLQRPVRIRKYSSYTGAAIAPPGRRVDLEYMVHLIDTLRFMVNAVALVHCSCRSP